MEIKFSPRRRPLCCYWWREKTKHQHPSHCEMVWKNHFQFIFKFVCSKQKTHFTLATSGVCILAYGQRTQQHYTLNSKELKYLKEAIFSKDWGSLCLGAWWRVWVSWFLWNFRRPWTTPLPPTGWRLSVLTVEQWEPFWGLPIRQILHRAAFSAWLFLTQATSIHHGHQAWKVNKLFRAFTAMCAQHLNLKGSHWNLLCSLILGKSVVKNSGVSSFDFPQFPCLNQDPPSFSWSQVPSCAAHRLSSCPLSSLRDASRSPSPAATSPSILNEINKHLDFPSESQRIHKVPLSLALCGVSWFSISQTTPFSLSHLELFAHPVNW